MTPRVSVIVPAYNAAAYLRYALDSVIAQSYADWEIVLVDDGSSDDTRALVDSYRARLQDKLHYIHQSNRGLPAARNTGIHAARGEFIALLDADDIWLPHRLQRSIQALDAIPAAGLAHARVRRINAQGYLIGQLKVDAKYMSGRIARHIYTRRAHIVCPTVTFRKSCLQTAGWFDERMRATEDRDLWFRIARQYAVVYIDEVLAHYRLSPSSMSSNLERLMKGQVYFIEKHHKSGAAPAVDRLRALGNIHRELGDSLFRGGAVARATRSYLRAVLYYPFNILNVYMLIRAVLDPVVRSAFHLSRLRSART